MVWHCVVWCGVLCCSSVRSYQCCKTAVSAAAAAAVCLSLITIIILIMIMEIFGQLLLPMRLWKQLYAAHRMGQHTHSHTPERINTHCIAHFPFTFTVLTHYSTALQHCTHTLQHCTTALHSHTTALHSLFSHTTALHCSTVTRQDTL